MKIDLEQLKNNLETLAGLEKPQKQNKTRSYFTERKNMARKQIVADKARCAIERLKDYSTKLLYSLQRFTQRELDYYNLK